MKACPFCAEEIQDLAIVCKHCGRDLVAATPSAPAVAIAAPQQGPSRTKIVIGLLAAVFVIAGVSCTLAMLNVGGTPTGSGSTTSGDTRRAGLLRLAITGVGESCDDVTEVFHAGAGAQGDFWNARCRDGHSYSVRQTSDGEVQVLSCEMLRRVARLECFVPLEQQR